MIQSLAFVPENDVINAFLELKTICESRYLPLMSYVEKNYIGKLKVNSRSIRMVPHFLIKTWNFYERVINKLPRTTNAVESWHSQVSADSKKHLNVYKIIELFRLEQANTEMRLVQLLTGSINKTKTTTIEKNDKIFYIVLSYDKTNLIDYLKKISLVL